MPWEKTRGGYTKAKKDGKGGFIRNPKQYEKLKEKGFPKDRAAAISNSSWTKGHKHKVSKTLTPAQTARRKRVAADLGVASATIGLGTLAARGGEGALKRVSRPGAARLADHIHQKTQTALIVGTGVGSIGALNSASINRTEAKRHMSKASPTSVTATPTGKQTAKATLKQISTGSMPQINAAVPGANATRKLSNTIGMSKGLKQGLKEGYKLAGSPAGPGRASARAGSLTRIAGRHAGAAGHDFKAGYSRHIHETTKINAGLTTTGRNATYPGAFKAGSNTRRYATPAVVLGGSYYGGKKMARRKYQVSKADRRFTGQTNTNPLHFPKHAVGTPVSQIAASVKPKPRPMPGTLKAVKIAKADQYKSAGRTTLGTLTPAHGLIAGKKGRKLRAAGSELGGAVGGGLLGGAIAGAATKGRAAHIGAVTGGLGGAYGGVQHNYKKQNYKPLSKSYGYDPENARQRRAIAGAGVATAAGIGTSAFGVAHAKKSLGHITPNKSKVTGKLTSVRIGRQGLEHGGKGLAGAAAGGALIMAGHKIRQKQQSSWSSY
jgi:hypothetical protein